MIEYGKVTKKALYEMVQQHEAQDEARRQGMTVVNAKLAQLGQVINRAENAEALATRLRIELDNAKNHHVELLEKLGMAWLAVLERGAASVVTEKSATAH